MFLPPDVRKVLETLYTTARHGGLLALPGESGSGKSVLRAALIDRLEREESRVVVMEPYVLGMDEGSKKQPGMKMSHICEAVITALDGSFRSSLSPEGMFRHMHMLLKKSASAGYRHLLIIEEAHSMSPAVIKSLKRLFELRSGLTRLLSVILIGQPELRYKLAETNAEVREVAQRMELVELTPLADPEGYVRHRCQRAGAKFEDIFMPDAMSALTVKLTGPSPKGKAVGGMSLLYPLLVGNILTRAINQAENIKCGKVSAAVLQMV